MPQALQIIRDEVFGLAGRPPIAAVAHRVVHGGAKYVAPTRVDAQVLADLKALVLLAPLHQPFCAGGHRDPAARAVRSTADRLLRHGLPPHAAAGRAVAATAACGTERGLRRYGFHGLSYEYMAVVLAERHGEARRAVTLVAHLGSGASLCDARAKARPRPWASALDGLMMGTRTGALDPGAVLYLDGR